MVEIFSIQHEEGKISNFVSRVGFYESFEQYVRQDIDDRELTGQIDIIEKHVDEEKNTVITKFWLNLEDVSIVVVHFAQQTGIQ